MTFPWEMIVLSSGMQFLQANVWKIVVLFWEYGPSLRQMCGKWLCCPWEWPSCGMFKVYLLLMDFFFEEVQFHLKIYSFHQQSNYVKCLIFL